MERHELGGHVTWFCVGGFFSSKQINQWKGSKVDKEKHFEVKNNTNKKQIMRPPADISGLLHDQLASDFKNPSLDVQ